jgi:hypothetical protein
LFHLARQEKERREEDKWRRNLQYMGRKGGNNNQLLAQKHAKQRKKEQMEHGNIAIKRTRSSA